MKNILLLLIIAGFITLKSEAQSFAINTDGSTANSSALLDVKSTAKGVLIPRMSKSERNAISSPATGLLIFQNAPDSAGFYYYDGSKWNWMAAINGNADTLAWKRSGNAGTNPATHFIGTTDNRVLNFRVNNIRSGIIDNVAYNSALGFSGLLNNSSGTHNTAIGFGSMISNTTGNFNTAVGAFSFYTNVAGIRNTAIGTSALYFNNANDNTAVGYEALNQSSSISATNNTAIGSNALRQNISGTSNTAIGDSAGFISTAANYNVLLGKNAGYNNIGSWTTMIGIDVGRTNQANGSVFIGSAAGMKNTTGNLNSFVGDNAGRDNTTGSGNTFFGRFTGQLSNGNDNSFFGRSAGLNNTSGNNNVFMGSQAGFSNTTGSANAAFGTWALFSNSVASANTAIGSSALYWNTTGINNTAIGFHSVFENNTGSYNTGLGYESLESNLGGNNNAAIGYRSLYSSTYGHSNIAIGREALRSNTTSSNLIAIGDSALYSNTAGIGNTAVGSKALYANTDGYYNTAVGLRSLATNTTGISNTAMGHYALGQNTTGDGNTANGLSTLGFNTTGSYNTAIGHSSLIFNTTGSSNSAVGQGSLYTNNAGNFNTANGNSSLLLNTIGSLNLANGFGSLNNNTTGNNNTAIGSFALQSNSTGSSNTALGYLANTALSNLTNATAIGALARVDTDNSMVLGSINGINGSVANTNVGIGTTAPIQARLTVSANSSSSGSTLAIFGYNQAGISLQQNNPTIGFNQYRDISAGNATKYMGNGFAWINHMEPTTGNMYWNSMPSGVANTAGGAESLRMTLTNTGSLGLNVIPNGSGQLQFQNVLNNRKIVMWETVNNSIDFFGFGINSATLRYQVPAGGNVHRFYAGNTLLFTLFGNGDATLTGFLTTASDARLKKNINPINSALSDLKKLNAYTYNWKDENKNPDQQIGLLAQEVEKVYPQLIKKDTAGIMSVNYSGFVPLLIKGMQEQQQTIEQILLQVKLLEEQNKLLLQLVKEKN